MPQNTFTGTVARTYDAAAADMYATRVLEPTVRFLAEIAADGGALEFGIGTGRVALPLSRCGVDVHGIDISADMLRELQAKPGAESIHVVQGDFATTRLDKRFDLVYLVYNVISNLTTQAEQVECIRNAARHLVEGGRLVIELWVPDLRRFPPGAVAIPFDVSPSHVAFDELDVATQQGVSRHFFIERDRVDRFDSPFRYVWPPELDLMAQLGGLRFQERWADWDRSRFTSDSTKHVSVYQRLD